jgi:hypothetical protein
MEPIVRLTRIAAGFAVALALLLVTHPAHAAEEEWEFDGGGWGHGVGLSQFGALGQAEDGRSASQILSHYYAGTSITSPLPGGHWTTQPNGLWVGLVSNTTSINLTAVGGPLTICQPFGTCPPTGPYSEAGFTDVTIDPGETWRFEVNDEDNTECRFRKASPDDPVGNLGWGPCDAALTKADGTSVRFGVNGKQYSRGSLRFTPSSSGFHVLATLDLEQYLYGLAEVPSSWPSEALKAQAIIGRSYAVATAMERGGSNGSGKLSSCGCHLRSTTADQAYAGWAKEGGSFGASWVAAVDDTDGQLMIHPQSDYAFDVAKAFYSSSNGGASEDVEFVWGGAALPWLRSTDDPWSSDPSINPLARWTVVVPSSRIESAFGWDTVNLIKVITGPPGAVIRFTGSSGGGGVTKDLWGDQLRLFLNANAYRRDGAAVRVSPYLIAVRYQGPFLDISGNIFENAINWMAQEEITVGCNPPSNTNYCPNDRLTRGEMAVFISRVMSLPGPSDDHFIDDAGMFYEESANRLYEAGITLGCNPPSNTKYCGDQFIPREQMAALLTRALDLPAAGSDYFGDDNTSQFEYAINRIAESQITLGCNPPSNDKFCPREHVTRGEMAAFFMRAWGP